MSRSFLVTCVLFGLLTHGSFVFGQQMGLVGHWPLNEGTGTTTADVSGNGHAGTLMGDPQWVPGVFESALDFNGASDYVEIPHTARLDIENQITIAAWIKVHSFLDWAGVLARDAAPDRGTAYGMQVWGDGSLRFVANQLIHDAVGGGEWNSLTKMPVDEWTHAAVTYDAKVINFYINGVKDEREVVREIVFGVTSNALLLGVDLQGGVEFFHGTVDDVWLYDRGLSEDEIWRVMAGGSFNFAMAFDPANDANDVARDAILSWTPGESAATHNVYLGTSFADVNDATADNPLGTEASIGQDANVYVPEALLEYGQIYHWRVDEVNAPPDSTVFAGDVLTFETEPFVYPVENIVATASSAKGPNSGPENTVNGSGLNADDQHSTSAKDMWLSQSGSPEPIWIQYAFDRVYKLHELLIWNSNQSMERILYGVGVKDVTIELSIDGENWTTFGEVEIAQATGKPDYVHNTRIDFQGALAQVVRLTAKNNWKGAVPQFSLSEVRFLYLPVQARKPQPADGAMGIDPGVALTWRAGREAAKHDVVLSTDRTAVEDGSALVDTVMENRFDPAGLEIQLDTQYYWRINEVNETEDPTTWLGDIWGFSTPLCIVIDDMESYAGSPGLELWSTWVDGFNISDNGSLVGNGDNGVPETLIIHGGDQSMSFYYDNTSAATSVATRTFNTARDWTRGGIQTLVLYVQGAPSNSGGEFFVTINNTKVVYNGNEDIVNGAFWTTWIIDLATVATDLERVTSLSIGIQGGQFGVVFVDDIRLYKEAPVLPEQVFLEAESGTIALPFMTQFDNLDSSGGQYIGTFDSDETGLREDGMATYSFTVQGGTYKVYGRVITANDADSFWVRIPGATLNTIPHSDNDGFVRWNNIPHAEFWHWDDVHNDQGPGQNGTVLFTLAAGTYTLEIGYREDGALLDAIVIEKQFD